MGSSLIGRRGWRGKCEHRHRVDVRKLKRWGLLLDGAIGSIWWSRDGRETGRIGIRMSGNYLRFDYRWRRSGETDWIAARREVGIQTTSCHFGGVRHWFVCACNRRCAIVYVSGPNVGCRECLDLAYASQSEDEIGRAWLRVHRLQRQLALPDSLQGWCFHPPRPKGMHLTTFKRLRDRMVEELHEIERLVAIGEARLVERLARYDGRKANTS